MSADIALVAIPEISPNSKQEVGGFESLRAHSDLRAHSSLSISQRSCCVWVWSVAAVARRQWSAGRADHTQACRGLVGTGRGRPDLTAPLGLGAGHHSGGAGEFGYPAGKTVSRYAESLEIVVSMLRGETVTFEGEFHRAEGA